MMTNYANATHGAGNYAVVGRANTNLPIISTDFCDLPPLLNESSNNIVTTESTLQQ
jgi:hypothetical protein